MGNQLLLNSVTMVTMQRHLDSAREIEVTLSCRNEEVSCNTTDYRVLYTMASAQSTQGGL